MIRILKPAVCPHCYLYNHYCKNPSYRSEPTVEGHLQIVKNLVSPHRQFKWSKHPFNPWLLAGNFSSGGNCYCSGCAQWLDSQCQACGATKHLQTEARIKSSNLPYFPVPCVQLTAKQVGWDCCLFSFLTDKEKAKTLPSE